MSMTQLLAFEGRIGRTVWWVSCAALSAVYGLVLYMFYPAVSLWLLPALAPALWVLAATSTRRLHDRSKSGWWQIVGIMGAAAVIWVKSQSGIDDVTGLVIILAGGSLMAWTVLNIAFLPGDPGINPYGERRTDFTAEFTAEDGMIQDALALAATDTPSQQPASAPAAGPPAFVERRAAHRREGFGRRNEGLPERRGSPNTFGRRAPA